MKKILFIILAVFSLVCFSACNNDDNKGGGGDNNKPSDPTPTQVTEVISDKKAQYLIFMVEGSEIAKMVVVETDTYEELKDYFPTIPEKEDSICYWEEKEVYSEDQNEIYINAYYQMK